METQPLCKNCGKPVDPGAAEGLCPACLMKVAMGTQPPNPPGGDPGAVPRQAHPLPDPKQLAASFPHLEIMELLGQGGMGAVYKARQPALDRMVALKILPVEAAADPGFAERFNREAKALARLNHAHIVAVYDFGQAAGFHYLIMEFVDGANLRQVQRSGKLSPREALQIIPQICEALQFAHDEGVVHRDIKPENVLLDKKGRVKIADFGLAKILGREQQDFTLTGAKDVMGTPHYMAPEQVEHPQAVDHRADIYSLGVVFYEMLTGELPLGKFAPPSRKVHVDVRLDEVVLHALEKEPERRYQHASEVKCDLETIAGTPAAAPPVAHAAARDPQVSAADDAWRQVKAPGAGLVVTAILNWISIPVILLVGNLFIFHVAPEGGAVAPFVKVGFLGILLLVLFLSSVVLVAGLKMRRLEAWRLCVAGSVLAILTAPGSIVGLPIGLWSLVVLTRREVRSAFKARADGKLGRPITPPPAPGAFAWKVAAVAGAVMLGVLVLSVASLVVSMLLPALHRAKALQTNYVLTGIVSDAVTGKPVPNAQVADNGYGGGSTHPPASAWTTSEGRFLLRTWSEEHTVSATAPGYETVMKNHPVDTQSLATNRGMGVLNFQLQPARTASSSMPAGTTSFEALEASDPPKSVTDSPPVVIRTLPESGSSGVDPNLRQLSVTFSAPMKDGSWAWCTWADSLEYFPTTTGQSRFAEDGRTCFLPVKLEPSKVYALWINSGEHTTFQDRSGRPAVPYLLIFQTRK